MLSTKRKRSRLRRKKTMASTPFGHHADGLFQTCNRKYFWLHKRHYTSPASIPLGVGSAVHAGLAAYHRPPLGGRVDRALLATDEALNEFRPTWDEDTTMQATFQSLKIMKAYAEAYSGPDPWEV